MAKPMWPTSMDLTIADWTDPKTLAGKEDWQLFNIIRKGTGATCLPRK